MKPGRRVPLFLAKIDGEWRCFQNERDARGHGFDAVILLRNPTKAERDSVRAGLIRGGPKLNLWDLSVAVETESGVHRERVGP
jgi:hypothetical protein